MHKRTCGHFLGVREERRGASRGTHRIGLGHMAPTLGTGARSLAMMLNGLVWSLRSASTGEARAALSGRVAGWPVDRSGSGVAAGD